MFVPFGENKKYKYPKYSVFTPTQDVNVEPSIVEEGAGNNSNFLLIISNCVLKSATCPIIDDYKLFGNTIRRLLQTQAYVAFPIIINRLLTREL